MYANESRRHRKVLVMSHEITVTKDEMIEEAAELLLENVNSAHVIISKLFDKGVTSQQMLTLVTALEKLADIQTKA